MNYLTEVEKEVLLHGLRWTCNILVELLGNYGTKAPEEVHCALRTAADELQKAQSIVRRG